MARQGCEKHGHINCSACADEAELTRLRADVARLTGERDEARRGYGDLRVRLEERSRELATAMGQNERYRRALSAAKADIGTVAITGSRAKAETARARIDAALAPEQEAQHGE